MHRDTHLASDGITSGGDYLACPSANVVFSDEISTVQQRTIKMNAKQNESQSSVFSRKYADTVSEPRNFLVGWVVDDLRHKPDAISNNKRYQFQCMGPGRWCRAEGL